MTFAAAIPALIQAAASIGGGYLAGKGQGKETKIQKKQRQMIDQLIASLTGDGPYANLFQTDEAAFQKSFVDPAKALFKNQIAPQIQQSSIAYGQQRGTGLDDQLLRAGVDLDQLLNQNYMQFQESGKNRMQQTIANILGQPSGGSSSGMSGGDALKQSGSGYLSSDAFSDAVKNIFKTTPTGANTGNAPQARKGYTTPNYLDYGLNDQRWGQ